MKPSGLNYLLSNNCGACAGRKRNDMHLKYNRIPMHGSLSPSRETCLCQFGLLMGFRKENLDKYQKKMTINSFVPNHHTLIDNPNQLENDFEVPSMSTKIFSETTKGTFILIR